MDLRRMVKKKKGERLGREERCQGRKVGGRVGEKKMEAESNGEA